LRSKKRTQGQRENDGILLLVVVYRNKKKGGQEATNESTQANKAVAEKKHEDATCTFQPEGDK
jgi:hypothetical protein